MYKKIGFIGQGWVGKNYADWYTEHTNFELIRYALEPEYKDNKDAIKECEVVFIAVPVPTTPKGFNYDSLDKVLDLIGHGKIALIKSSLVPGVTRLLQKKHPNIHVLFSPEFLTEKTAAHDVARPDRNIIGYVSDEAFKQCGELMTIFPPAPYEEIMSAEAAEMIKYGGNNWFYFKVIFINLLYDLCEKKGIDYNIVKEGMAADRRIGKTHLEALHQGGRGAGGNCFIKDFEAFRRLYYQLCDDDVGRALLSAMAEKNLALLKESGKDQDLVRGVYGADGTVDRKL